MAYALRTGSCIPRRVRPLRGARGLNVVAALRDGAFDGAERFDEAAKEITTTHPEDVLSLQLHPDFALAT